MKDQSERDTYFLSRQREIVAKCFHPGGNFAEFEESGIEQSISSCFEKQVDKYPQRLAVKSRNQELTYNELNNAANRLANAILNDRGAGQEPVAFLLEHGALPIVAILGILKAGKIYVPLEPTCPPDRNAYILENSGASLIVTNNKNLPLTRHLAKDSYQFLNIDELPSYDKNFDLSISADAIAYIIYTSGSTGQPKGVYQNHRNTIYDTKARINAFHVCPDDRISILTSISFAVSLRKIFPALLTGASIHTLDVKEEGVTNLPDWLVQQEITIHGGRAVFRDFLDILTGKEKFPAIRLFTSGGDSLHRRDVEAFRKFLSPDCIMVNGLGLTEAGTVTNYFMDKDTQLTDPIVPIGYQIDDRKVLVLDETGKEVPHGEIGEIAIQSRYITLGYWRRPDLTQSRFLPDPEGGDERIYMTGDLGCMMPDGCLIHKGRKDFQVKIRGYRVEIAETEAFLLEHPAIKKASVVAREDRPGDKRLVAYVAVDKKPGPKVSELRHFLLEKLPEYMAPSAFVIMDEMPLTPTGKIDRQKLPAPGTGRPDLENPFIAPQTSVEKTLAEIWSQVLGLDEVGIQDNFFDLGGHSLLATRVVSRVIDKFQVEVTLGTLFQSPTVADMATAIVQRQAETVKQEDMAQMLAEIETLSDDEAQKLLADPDN